MEFSYEIELENGYTKRFRHEVDHDEVIEAAAKILADMHLYNLSQTDLFIKDLMKNQIYDFLTIRKVVAKVLEEHLSENSDNIENDIYDELKDYFYEDACRSYFGEE